MRAQLNPLALFAIAIALYGVATNWALAGTPLWLLGGACGLAAGLAGWVYPQRVGLALGVAAAVLCLARLFSGAANLQTLAITAGACAGALSGLLICAALHIRRRG